MNSKTTSRKLSGNIVLQSVLDEKILEVYSALRANRLSKEELLAMADELENEYGAIVNANFVRRAVVFYEMKVKLRKD